MIQEHKSKIITITILSGCITFGLFKFVLNTNLNINSINANNNINNQINNSGKIENITIYNKESNPLIFKLDKNKTTYPIPYSKELKLKLDNYIDEIEKTNRICNSKFDIAYSTYKQKNIDKNLFDEASYYCRNSMIGISEKCIRPEILGIENEYLLSNLCNGYERIAEIKYDYSSDVVLCDDKEKDYYVYNVKYTETDIEKKLQKIHENIELNYKKILNKI